MGMNSQDDEEISEINMTPLVDVMLVLLIIFIITVPVLKQAVPIELPQASSQPLSEKPQMISLSIDAGGKYYWNNQVLSQRELKAKLGVAAAQKPQPEFNIRADKETRYQVLASLMADMNNAGIAKLGFVSEPQ